MELLRRAPDRITRIALMATTPLPDTPPAAAERETLIIKARTGRLEEAMRDFILAAGLAPGAARLDLAAAYGGMASELGPDIYVRQARALQRRRDQQSTLARCAVPALILCGAHDQLCPVKRHTFMAEMTPGAQLVVIDDAGHLPSVEAPEAVCAALRDWLGLPFVLR
jgi:pimeloyl-ACP methyl ester carboxylesterase